MKSLKGYKAKNYSYAKTLKRFRKFKKTGKFSFRKDGSGHTAGEDWGKKKGIDPNSTVKRYSKNSPSFDEGVHQYKASAKNRALNSMRG